MKIFDGGVRSVVRWSLFAIVGMVVIIGVTRWSTIDAFARRYITHRSNPLSDDASRAPEPSSATDHGDHEHEGHTHEHMDEGNSLTLSEQAMRNLGLDETTIRPIQLENYRRSVCVPGVVVSKPGRTEIQVATPMTGVITHVHAVKGEAVEPGSLLFQIRLTHEDLVIAQTEFMKALLELEVENREINRLRAISQDGAIPGNTLLQREYAKEKLEAILKVQRESLRLHGLSDTQIGFIERERRLLRELQVVAPSSDEHPEDEELRLSRSAIQPVAHTDDPSDHAKVSSNHPLIIAELDVHKGQSVEAGTRLCVLSNYESLYIEGRAFEKDLASIMAANDRQWEILAKCAEGSVRGLKIAFIPNEVDVESRTMHFYVDLPNTMDRSTVNEEGQRFVTWKYRPGQRIELEVPVEEWEDQIVLPVDAVTRDGVDSYVFQQNGDRFDRVAIHVKYQGQDSVVVANDGSIFPGDLIALKSAHQLQMAIKNKSGGGIDPHAGHHH